MPIEQVNEDVVSTSLIDTPSSHIVALVANAQNVKPKPMTEHQIKVEITTLNLPTDMGNKGEQKDPVKAKSNKHGGYASTDEVSPKKCRRFDTTKQC